MRFKLKVTYYRRVGLTNPVKVREGVVQEVDAPDLGMASRQAMLRAPGPVEGWDEMRVVVIKDPKERKKELVKP